MSLHTITEEAPTLAGSGSLREELTPAERYARLRQELKSQVPAERKAAAVALVQAGSDAVFPLLRTVEDDDDYEVAVAALWSLLRLTDDLLCETAEELDSPQAIALRGRVTEPYLRVGLEAVAAWSTGKSPANEAYGWAHHLTPKTQKAGIGFLRDLVRLAPDLDPDLPKALKRMARWHPLPGIRRCGAHLLEEYESWRVQGVLPNAARLAQSLADRRLAAREGPVASNAERERLLIAATTDPDRTVRHIAGARLYYLVSHGAVVRTSAGGGFKDPEVGSLFLEGSETLRANLAPVEALTQVANLSPRSRRCALRLLVHLRPFVNDMAGADLDEFVRESMRDANREVRRDATAAAKTASSDSICTELTGRLREQLRKSPPRLLLLFPFLWITALVLSFVFRKVWWVGMLPHLVNAVFMGYVALRDRGQHGVTHDEYLETLSALARIMHVVPKR